jgi:uncharacterized damage-inducible protein DinB
MAEDNFTLTTFYTSWKAYQDHLKDALAPLTAEQLALRAAPGLRSIGENAAHIIGCRIGWFTSTLGEDGGADAQALSGSLESRRYAPDLSRRLGWRASRVVARLGGLACTRT